MNKLNELIIKRNNDLERIAVKQVMDLERGTYIQPKELVDIFYDNSITEAYMNRYFDLGFLAMPAQAEELHLKRCENSGIPECTCMVSHDIPGLTDVTIL